MKEKRARCDLFLRLEDIDRALLPVDDIDVKILCYLRENARAPNAEIAKKIGVSEATIRRRIKELERKGIITGFSVLLNCLALENSIKAFIHIKVGPNEVDDVANSLSTHPRVITLYRVLGEFDLICEALFMSMKEMQDFMDNEMKAKGIESSVTYVVAKSYKSCPWIGV